MAAENENQRLETFCDGVIAIAITLLILEIKVPPIHSVNSLDELRHALIEAWPHWFGFLISFLAIFISWVNHHNVFKLIDKSSVPFIYANGFFLLTVVVMPFTTALMAEYIQTVYAQPAISLYCFGTLVHNIAWNILSNSILPLVRRDDARMEKVMIGVKNTRYGFFLYVAIFVLSFWFPITAMILTTISWLSWLVIGFFLRLD